MNPITLTYKVVDEVPIKIDVYLPAAPSGPLPAVVYFHGGGLIIGSRKDLFPTWLQTRVTSAGHAFISADYRLIPTGSVTGHEVLEDIKDLFAFLRDQDLGPSTETGEIIQLDPGKIAVAGSSAGGLCAYLAAMHIEPKPVAVLSIFGVGGDFLSPFYTTPKTEPFVRGRPLVDTSRFTDYIYPLSPTVSSQVLSESPITFVPNSSPPIPANPRMPVTFVYLQLGKYLDYYTGQHEPSLDPSAIPERHQGLFPQLNVSSSWPPTYLLHGDQDTSVLIDESKNIHRLLTDVGVSSTLKIVPGQDHFFDLQTKDPETAFAEYFDDAAGFLKNHL